MRESTMREQELEVVKTAYFLEDQIVHQTQELQRVNGDKPARPAQPREPHLEKHSAQKIPYPEIKPVVDLPKPVRWKLWMKVSLGGLALSIIASWPDWIFLVTLGIIVFLLAPVYGAVVYFKDNAAHKQAVANLTAQRTEEIRNSPEYIQKCREIDEQNQQNQAQLDKELHEKYLRRYEQYKADMKTYEQDVVVYNEETYPQWKEEEQAIETALSDTKAALKEVYSRNVLPAQYRNRAAVLYLAVFMGTSDFDLKYAIERYDTSVMLTAQREQIDLARAQVALANEAIQNQEYANWLNEQTLNMAEQGNEILKSIYNWQKADIAIREYRRFKARRAAKKASK